MMDIRRTSGALFILAATGAFLSLRAAAAVSSRIVVNVTGVRSDKGAVEIRLWNGKDGFPKDDSKAYRRARVAISGSAATITFEDVPPGDYAVSVFHDENGNGKLDTRFPGIPVEGVGVSNDPHKKFGPPPFSACHFEVNAPQQIIPVVIDY